MKMIDMTVLKNVNGVQVTGFMIENVILRPLKSKKIRSLIALLNATPTMQLHLKM
jgi:hypothetical protein